MYLSLLSLFIFLTGSIFQNETTYKVHELRQVFAKSANSKETCENLLQHLNKYKGKDPVVLGYKAATQGVMAKHAWSPYYKLKYLKTSANLFADVLTKYPDLAEVHFLRYSIEYYVPRYLNLSGHLKEDKAVFFKSLLQYPNSNLDPEAFQIVRNFLMKTPDHLTEQERRQLATIKS